MIHYAVCAPKKIVKAEIVSKTQVASTHFQMGLLCPYIARNSQPGQFIQVRVSEFSYDPLLCRPLAVYWVRDDIFEILFKVVGKGTRLLSQKKIGDVITVTGPLGNCFPINGDFQRVILISGGMGIAALMGLAESLDGVEITALLGASSEDKIIGEKELMALDAEIRVATEDGSAGHKGLITELLQETLSDHKDNVLRIFACGPVPMLKAVAEIAMQNEIPAYVSLEERMACGVGACLGCACEVVSQDGGTEYKMVCTDGPIFDAREIVWK
jgi:dihydroorotate dehydrogenase electron transfer subunit